mgnify:CR=1 FL=1
MTNKRKIYVSVSWILVAVCMGIIFSLSAQNGEESSDLSGSFVMAILEWLKLDIDEGFLRTCAHCLEFMGLSLLIFNATYATWEKKITPLIAFAGTVLYAITDEIHQIFVPERAFQISDLTVDLGGIILGTTVIFLLFTIVTKISLKKKKGESL